MYQYKMHSEADTAAFGLRLAGRLTAGDVICLSGELGTGKTTLSKSIIRGLGVTEMVTSPTFTIIHEYEGRLPVYHFDVYRIDEIGELFEVGCEEYFFGEGVCIVEWAEKIEEILPTDCIRITIEYSGVAENTEERIFTTNVKI